MPRPVCNRDLPEEISRRIGRYTLKNSWVTASRNVHLIPPGPVPFQGNTLLAYALKPEHYRNPFVHVPLRALVGSLSPRAAMKQSTFSQACLLTNAWNRTYHHWVAELLPQIVILEQAGINCTIDQLKFVVPPALTSWQRESLELMGIPASALVHVDAPMLVDQLLVPSFARREVTSGGWSILSPRILRQFRDRMYGRCGVQTTTPPARKIYISRRFALGRQVMNEGELEEALSRLGFEVVITEHMTYAQEVRLFSGAQVVVGPSGSGLSNVVFCRGRVKVIEIAGDEKGCKYPDSTDYSLSSGLGHDFSVYLAKTIRRLAPARFDLVVEVEDFCRFLKGVLK